MVFVKCGLMSHTQHHLMFIRKNTFFLQIPLTSQKGKCFARLGLNSKFRKDLSRTSQTPDPL